MSRHVSSIFCDDIRHELGNKQSYMGVYFGSMQLPNFPIILPRLCITLAIQTPKERPFKKLHIKILKDQSVLREALIPDEALEESDPRTGPPDPDRNDRIFVFNAAFAFSPFPIDEPTTIRIRVQTEDEELKAPGLRIEAAVQP